MSEGFEYPSEVEVIRESDSGKALLVKDDEGEEFWIPKSQIHEDSEVFKPDGVNSYGRLIVTQWLAKEKGWA
jgi:hypothetical protein